MANHERKPAKDLTGRNYIGFEQDEKYHAIAMQRVADEVDRLLAEDDEISLF